ncbi:MAG: ROK family protein [Hungatella sp.]|nr:ROK family protein [Hungatella sp.]
MSEKYLCIDVGGSSIKHAVLDEALNISSRGTVKTPYEGLECYLKTLEEIFKPFEGQVSGIAMSVPGVIDSQNGICITGGALEDFVKELPLAREMEKRCHVPVTLMNDAKSAALAEAGWGALTDCKDAVVLVFGTGVGGALIKDGKVHMGKHFSAGEFSWIMMNREFDQMENSWACRSGNRRLVSLAASVKGVDKESITSFDVFRWAEEGDEAALWALDLFTRDIAYMIINLQSVYDPECFAIGGGISRQPLFLDTIRKNLNYYHSLCPFPVPKPQVVECKYHNDSNMIGALKYFLDRSLVQCS